MPRTEVVDPATQVEPGVGIRELFAAMDKSSSTGTMATGRGVITVDITGGVIAFTATFSFLMDNRILASSLFFILGLDVDFPPGC